LPKDAGQPSLNKVVLDASAILALLNDEPGSGKLTPELLSRATTSAVNLAEVQTILVREGGDPDECWALAVDPIPEVEPFTAEHARIAGTLIQETSSLGLSLGDRACLALAIALDAPVYTTDRLWKKLKLSIPIHLLR
jgi:ribonuclease VapC